MSLRPGVKHLNKKRATSVLMQRLTAYISGKVQKTGYRARVLAIARDFGLKGYVQNLDDGRVKVVAEGEAGDLESLLAALAIKNTIINVVDIKSEYSSASGDFGSFVKVVSGGETDQRLDVAAELLTKLIVVNEKILDEIRATRTELTEIHQELAETHQELTGTHQELTGTHEDLKGAINESRDAIVSEIRELRVDLRENLEGRLIRMESDISQIKAKVAL
jgi:acylphosphatase